jgi:hypothetical protein
VDCKDIHRRKVGEVSDFVHTYIHACITSNKISTQSTCIPLSSSQDLATGTFGSAVFVPDP